MLLCASLAPAMGSLNCGAKVGLELPEVVELRPSPVALMIIANHDNGSDLPAVVGGQPMTGREAQLRLLLAVLPPIERNVSMGAIIDRDNETLFLPNCFGETPMVAPIALNNARNIIDRLAADPVGNGAATYPRALEEALLELRRPVYQHSVRGILLLLPHEPAVCFPEQPRVLFQRYASQLNQGIWIIPVPAGTFLGNSGEYEANDFARAQHIERSPPAIDGTGERRYHYNVLEPEGVAGWIRRVLLARARCSRELPSHVANRSIHSLQIDGITYGASDLGRVWSFATEPPTVTIHGTHCEQQIDQPTTWSISVR